MADKTIGQNIRKLREARGLMQKELGELIGKKGATISNWELGLRDPGGDNIKLLAAALEVAPSEIIGHNQGVLQDDTFEVVCMDESMLPEIRPGDTVLASKRQKPKNGDYVFAYLEMSDRSIPVIRSIVSAGGSHFLIPINHQYPFSAETDFCVMGKIIQITRKL